MYKSGFYASAPARIKRVLADSFRQLVRVSPKSGDSDDVVVLRHTNPYR